MRTYFLQHGEDRVGPYSVNDLQIMEIHPKTPVWTEGMPGPAPAIFIPELKAYLFDTEPEPIVITHSASQRHSSRPDTRRLKTGSLWKMAGMALLLAVVSFLGFQYLGSGTATSVAAAEVNLPINHETKKDKKQAELSNAPKYIVNKGTTRSNIIGQTVLEGTLKNTASMANYKDPVLTVSWLSKTNTVMESKQCRVYEYVAAGKTIRYKIKVRGPARAKSVKVSVHSATGLE